MLCVKHNYIDNLLNSIKQNQIKHKRGRFIYRLIPFTLIEYAYVASGLLQLCI